MGETADTWERKRSYVADTAVYGSWSLFGRFICITESFYIDAPSALPGLVPGWKGRVTCVNEWGRR